MVLSFQCLVERKRLRNSRTHPLPAQGPYTRSCGRALHKSLAATTTNHDAVLLRVALWLSSLRSPASIPVVLVSRVVYKEVLFCFFDERDSRLVAPR